MRGDDVKYEIKSTDVTPLSFEHDNLAAEVVQNMSIVLNTPLGSVPGYREFGIDMSYLHAPKPIAQTMFVAAANEALEKFEPRGKVLEVKFDEDADGSTNAPILEVKIVE